MRGRFAQEESPTILQPTDNAVTEGSRDVLPEGGPERLAEGGLRWVAGHCLSSKDTYQQVPSWRCHVAPLAPPPPPPPPRCRLPPPALPRSLQSFHPDVPTTWLCVISCAHFGVGESAGCEWHPRLQRAARHGAPAPVLSHAYKCRFLTARRLAAATFARSSSLATWSTSGPFPRRGKGQGGHGPGRAHSKRGPEGAVPLWSTKLAGT